MEGEVVHGVLHGKVLVRGKDNMLIFSGEYDDVGYVVGDDGSGVVVVDDDDDDGYYMCHKDHLTPGRYKDGYPEGPAWIFSPTDSEGTEEGALYVHFKNGQLVTDSVVVVLPGWEKAIAGRY